MKERLKNSVSWPIIDYICDSEVWGWLMTTSLRRTVFRSIIVRRTMFQSTVTCRRFFWSICVCLALSTPLVVHGHIYRAPVDLANWQLESSRLTCGLSQEIPHYGEAVFQRKAGEPLRFFLHSARSVPKAGHGRLRSRPPMWKPGVPGKSHGRLATVAGKMPVQVGRDMASTLLAELAHGMSPNFTHNGWYQGHTLEVEVSSVHFSRAYQGYLECVQALLPHNFDQLKRVRLNFDFDKWRLTDPMRDKLGHIADYVEADKSVTKIYIDGHTDSVGRRGHNWELSRKRAEYIRQFLLAKGISQAIIVFGYHGEGRPLRSNNSAPNRAKNRRVTIRLMRDEKASL